MVCSYCPYVLCLSGVLFKDRKKEVAILAADSGHFSVRGDDEKLGDFARSKRAS
jgi:hypothetical protein